jgi:hypothetical protein
MEHENHSFVTNARKAFMRINKLHCILNIWKAHFLINKLHCILNIWKAHFQNHSIPIFWSYQSNKETPGYCTLDYQFLTISSQCSTKPLEMISDVCTRHPKHVQVLEPTIGYIHISRQKHKNSRLGTKKSSVERWIMNEKLNWNRIQKVIEGELYIAFEIGNWGSKLGIPTAFFSSSASVLLPINRRHFNLLSPLQTNWHPKSLTRTKGKMYH